MRATVTVIPRARTTRVERLEDGTLRVAVTAPPHEGRANAAVVAALAEHFGVPRSRVRILAGRSGRRKVVEVGGV
jgi:uncharacterized protein (TIGR00251 family)